MSATPDLGPEFLDALRAIAGERVSTSDAVRDHHSRDMSYHPAAAPDVVVFAHTTEEVSEVVRLCAAHKVPVVPFGTGTALEGHVQALHGGVCVDVSQMSEVLEVNNEDLNCRVQAGVTRKALNEYLRDTGLFFPIDPGADASIGGMSATGASGTNAVRYGTMRENVLGLTVVLSDGRVIQTGGRAKKSSAGYDLTRLFVGSEGTLGVITEIQLRLYGIPEAISSGVCSFTSLEDAVNTVITTIQVGVPIARIELLDDVQMDAVNRYSGFDYPVQPTLFFEFHGSDAGVAEQAATVGEIVSDFGGGDFQWAVAQEERNKLWQARHDAYYSAKALRTDCGVLSTDVCVPISKLADCIVETRADIDELNLVGPIVGHVGDGNFHVGLVLDSTDEDEMRRAAEMNDRLVTRALAVGGTCTGEHGVGSGKIKYLYREHGDALAVMRELKRAMDPDNLMNPGKVLNMN
ncbi:MAG: FAD-linked oxidase C-terminal domain-containing protein [Pseudomonadota bacterium]